MEVGHVTESGQEALVHYKTPITVLLLRLYEIIFEISSSICDWSLCHFFFPHPCRSVWNPGILQGWWKTSSSYTYIECTYFVKSEAKVRIRYEWWSMRNSKHSFTLLWFLLCLLTWPLAAFLYAISNCSHLFPSFPSHPTSPFPTQALIPSPLCHLAALPHSSIWPLFVSEFQLKRSIIVSLLPWVLGDGLIHVCCNISSFMHLILLSFTSQDVLIVVVFLRIHLDHSTVQIILETMEIMKIVCGLLKLQVASI